MRAGLSGFFTARESLSSLPKSLSFALAIDLLDRGRNLVEAPKWEPIERELLVVLLAINIFLRTADVKNLCEFLIFFDGLSEKKSISTLKTFWKVAYGKSIPNQYEPVRDLPFPWKKVSLRIDSLPTERKMLASIPSPFFL
ncbi:hypothetical protein RIF29_46993 [Crotalaria pallida]|uniref:Uncharacterized protein n=1 Tax=Crotalaria pallida TaxID=3830 RepID=A0AAN9DTT2_CROPI